MKTAIVYYRVSTIGQSEESQLDDLLSWAKREYKIVKVFGEKVSGINEEKKELEELKKYAIDKGIKNILVWSLDRLGRSTVQTLNHIDFFNKNGINVVFKKEGIETLSDNMTNQLLITLLSSVAEMDRRTILERTRTGRTASIKKGKRTGYIKIPYGYMANENGYLVVNEKEAEIVRTIFKEIIKGKSAMRIAKDLNLKGIPSISKNRGKKKVLRNGDIIDVLWSDKSVKNIIKRWLYVGEREHNNDIVEIPSIIDKETWKVANQRLKEKLGYVNRTKYEYVFKSKIICGQCGYTMKSLRKYSKLEDEEHNKLDVQYYTCQSYLHTTQNCNIGRFRSQVLDEKVYKTLFENAKGLLIVNKDRRVNTEKQELNKQKDYWNNINKMKESEKNRVLNLYKKGLINDEELDIDILKINKELKTITIELNNINDKFITLESENNVMDVWKKYLWESDYNMKREFVEKYVDKIVAYRVRQYEFELEETYHRTLKEKNDKINVGKKYNLEEPNKNEVLFYLEVFAFNRTEPIRMMISSFKDIKVVDEKLRYNVDTKSVYLEP